ncbi:MAG: VWA domain-containing protein [Candidatus Binatus sp.]|uniref:vWA domain-containing protein n=1 Tax=Candidatus Binatus sp. TaxID=2811406 RepID=UPI0027248782|nr:VWA domain-containing protein [Candidatus Binatus sp.]MDO8432574.1 VWA domain-containing protein [Candidatus Binatus sp.]
MAEPLSFDALASSEHVLSSAENFVLYVLLEAVARGGGGAGGARVPLNLGVVIDRSGSMYDERRLEFVVDAVKFLADHLNADDKVSIVAFADKAKVMITPEAARDKGAVHRAIDDIDLLEIGGGTQMALGMRAAIDEVKKNLSSDRLNRVLVLTDGQTYEETACLDLVEKNRDQISFSTMGVGVEFNEKLLQRLAQDSNGKYHFIGDPAEIPGIFEDELQGLRAVTLRNGRIDVTLSQGVQVREAFRASPEIYVLGSPLVGEDRKISYEIGDLQAGVPGSVLLTLVLPPRKPGMVRILQSSFHYEVPGAGEATANCDLAVDYTLDRTLTSKRNGRVMNLVDQVSIAKLQSKAEEELKAGNIDRATRLLGNALQGTQRMGNVKATQALAGLMDQIKKTQTLQTRAAKTTLLQAQAVVRKTQMLDPEALKDFQKSE